MCQCTHQNSWGIVNSLIAGYRPVKGGSLKTRRTYLAIVLISFDHQSFDDEVVNGLMRAGRDH